MRSPSPTTQLRWPADQFYWAVLDGSMLNGVSASGRQRQLGYLFESVLPGLAIEDVQAVYRRLPGADRRYLACGVPRAVLVERCNGAVVWLSPLSLPEFVDAEVDPRTLNLLTGPCLPATLRRQQRRWAGVMCAILLAGTVLILVGIERRARHAEGGAARLDDRRLQVIQQVLDDTATGAGQPPELLLMAELRRLEQTRSSDIALPQKADCSRLLADLLACWPAELDFKTQSLSVTPDGITLNGQSASMADAQALADALSKVPGFRLQQPRSETGREHVEVALHLAREQGKGS